MKLIKLHAEDPQILDPNVQTLVSRATWRSELVEAYFCWFFVFVLQKYKTIVLRPSYKLSTGRSKVTSWNTRVFPTYMTR